MAAIRQAAVLVGGLGTRLGAAAADLPKPLLAVGGRPFVAWVLAALAAAGIEDILLLAGYRSERVRDALPALRAHLPASLRLDMLEEPAQAGTGGALRHAHDRFDHRFVLANGDSLFVTDLAPLLLAGARDDDGVAGRLLLRRVADPRHFGVVELHGDRVVAFHERPRSATSDGGAWVNGGIAVLRRTVAASLPGVSSLERDGYGALAARGVLRGTRADGWFVDIGTPAELSRARAALPLAAGYAPVAIDG